MSSPLKVCRACKKKMPIGDFGDDKSKKDGKRSYCRDCDRRLARERAQKAKDKPKRYVEEKMCPDCKEVKPRREFFNYKRSMDGLSSYCKVCTGKRNKETQKRLKEKEPTVSEKKCPTCEEVKPASEFYLYPKRKDGLSWECKACKKRRTQNWVEDNPEQKKENDRRKSEQWKKDGRMAESRKRYLKKHPNYIKEWKEKNKEHIKEWFRDYMRLRRRDPEKRKKMREAARRWTKKHPRRNRLKAQRYKTRKLSLPWDFTEEDLMDTFMMFEDECAFCGAKGKLTLEHVVPLSREDVENPGTVRGNMMPLCKPCNSSKGTKLLSEYFAEAELVRPEVLKHIKERGLTVEEFLMNILFKLDMLGRS